MKRFRIFLYRISVRDTTVTKFQSLTALLSFIYMFTILFLHLFVIRYQVVNTDLFILMVNEFEIFLFEKSFHILHVLDVLQNLFLKILENFLKLFCGSKKKLSDVQSNLGHFFAKSWNMWWNNDCEGVKNNLSCFADFLEFSCCVFIHLHFFYAIAKYLCVFIHVHLMFIFGDIQWWNLNCKFIKHVWIAIFITTHSWALVLFRRKESSLSFEGD